MRLALLIAVCILTASAAAEEISPKLVGKSDAVVNVSWTLRFTSGLPTEVTLKVFAFPDTTYQEADVVSSSHPFTMEEDSWGNDMAVFTITPSRASELFWLQSRVRVDFEKSNELAFETAPFTEPSPLVILSPEARTLSQSVLGNARDEEALALATHWAHENINYDLSYWQRNTNSQETLATRAGVCKDLTHVEAALLRAQGIPTRFVAGFVYSGKDWGPHAWLEAAIDGEWVAADPTYNEGRTLDATHLAFAHGRDQGDIREEILTRPFTFSPSTIVLERNQSIEMTHENFSRSARIAVGELSGEFGSESVVEIPWEITALYPGIYPLEVSYPAEVRVLGEKSQLVALGRGESANGMYRVQLPAMKEGFVYTFPFEFSTLGARRSIELKGKSDGVHASVSDVQLRDVSASVSNGELSISATVENAGSTSEGITVTFEFLGSTQTMALELGSGEKKPIVFRTQEPANASRGAITLDWQGGNTRQAFTYTPQPPETAAVQDDSMLFMIAAAIAGLVLLYALAKSLKNAFR